MCLQRGLTYLGEVAQGKAPEKAMEIANSAVSDLQGLSEGTHFEDAPSTGKRHLLQVDIPKAL